MCTDLVVFRKKLLKFLQGVLPSNDKSTHRPQSKYTGTGKHCSTKRLDIYPKNKYKLNTNSSRVYFFSNIDPNLLGLDGFSLSYKNGLKCPGFHF